MFQNYQYNQENLAERYKKDVENQRFRYEKEKAIRIQKEQDSNEKIKRAIANEELEKYNRKKKLISTQYNDYLKGQEQKYEKILKDAKEKLEPTLTSLPLNSEERLRKLQDRIALMSEKSEKNGKLFKEFQKNDKNTSHYNYLTKRFSLDNKVAQMIPDEKRLSQPPKTSHNNSFNNYNYKYKNKIDNINNEQNNNNYGEVYLGLSDKQSQNLLFEGGKREGTDITNKSYFDRYYNKAYLSYKEINKQYEDYNRSLVQQNLKFREQMNARRKFQEELRKIERDKVSQMQYLKRMYDNDMKRQYKQYLDQQIVNQLPRKLYDEGYSKNSLINNKNLYNNDNTYNNDNSYNASYDFNVINKSKFVEVNPYCAKKYDLGKSSIENNPLINPSFNYRYNKYIVPLNKLNRDLSCPLLQTGINMLN